LGATSHQTGAATYSAKHALGVVTIERTQAMLQPTQTASPDFQASADLRPILYLLSDYPSSFIHQ
jgi:hypothetical protein